MKKFLSTILGALTGLVVMALFVGLYTQCEIAQTYSIFSSSKTQVFLELMLVFGTANRVIEWVKETTNLERLLDTILSAGVAVGLQILKPGFLTQWITAKECLTQFIWPMVIAAVLSAYASPAIQKALMEKKG